MEIVGSAVILQAVRSQLDKMHTSMPGLITAYDYTAKKASVKPMLKRVQADQKEVELPIITNVPVIFPGTSKGIVHLEITPGKDGCLLLFSERSLENWLSGDTVTPQSQADPRQCALADAICIPGLFSLAAPGQAAKNGTGIEIINSGGSYINIKDDGHIELNGDGNNLVTYAALNTALQTLVTNLQIYLATGAVTSAPGAVVFAGPYPSLDISAAKAATIKAP